MDIVGFSRWASALIIVGHSGSNCKHTNSQYFNVSAFSRCEPGPINMFAVKILSISVGSCDQSKVIRGLDSMNTSRSWFECEGSNVRTFAPKPTHSRFFDFSALSIINHTRPHFNIFLFSFFILVRSANVHQNPLLGSLPIAFQNKLVHAISQMLF